MTIKTAHVGAVLHLAALHLAAQALLALPACDDGAADPKDPSAANAMASSAGNSAPPLNAGQSGSMSSSAGNGAGGNAGQPNAAGGGGGMPNNSADRDAAMASGMDANTAMPGTDVDAGSGAKTLFWLDLTGNSVWRAATDGSNKTMLISGHSIATPDGVAVDLDADGGHIYWTNMGNPLGGGNQGSLQRARLDGSDVETIIPVGSIDTPKQMTIDHVHHKLYFCDREGAKVWRAELDGSQLEVLASGHEFVQLVGIALDVEREQFYFTDRMQKKIFRAGFAIPQGETAATRSDIEELFATSGDAMPIDLDLDVGSRKMYWTDRVEGTVHRAGMDLPAGKTPSTRTDVETLVEDVPDSIGIALDLEQGALYFGQLNGQVWRANLDGSEREMVARTTSVSGVTLARVPAM